MLNWKLSFKNKVVLLTNCSKVSLILSKCLYIFKFQLISRLLSCYCVFLCLLFFISHIRLSGFQGGITPSKHVDLFTILQIYDCVKTKFLVLNYHVIVENLMKIENLFWLKRNKPKSYLYYTFETIRIKVKNFEWAYRELWTSIAISITLRENFSSYL